MDLRSLNPSGAKKGWGAVPQVKPQPIVIKQGVKEAPTEKKVEGSGERRLRCRQKQGGHTAHPPE